MRLTFVPFRFLGDYICFFAFLVLVFVVFSFFGSAIVVGSAVVLWLGRELGVIASLTFVGSEVVIGLGRELGLDEHRSQLQMSSPRTNTCLSQPVPRNAKYSVTTFAGILILLRLE